MPRRSIVGMVLAFALVAGCGKGPGSSGNSGGGASANPAATLEFKDERKERGIDFFFQAGRTGKRWMPEQLGGGGAFFDCDGDHDLDLLLVNGGPLPGSDDRAPNALFSNDGRGWFTKVAGAGGLGGGRDYGVGCAVADVDIDGDIDVFITNWGPNRLYLNDGKGRFTDATEGSGIVGAAWSASAVFGDIDGDQLPDLYVTNYLDYDITKHKPCYQRQYEVYCGPQPYAGVADRLYKNLGGGRFEDRTAKAFNETTAGKGLACAMCDFDHDGDLDIYVANDQTPNFLWQNDGKGSFANIADLAGCASSKDAAMQAGMGVAFADLDNDLFEDIVVTNFEDQVNSVYRNTGDGFFEESSYQAGIGYESRPNLGWGVAAVDFDLDGWKDLMFSNGHIYDNADVLREGSKWAQRKCLHLNLTGGKFGTSVGTGGPALAVERVGRGLLWADIDDDGDIDVLVSNIEDVPDLLVNGRNGGNAVRVAPVHPKAKTPLYGARVEIDCGGKKQSQSCQGSSSYLASNDPRVHFGLGEAKAVDKLTVHWLGGSKTSFGPVPAGCEAIVSPGQPALLVDIKTRAEKGRLEPIE